MKTKAFSIFAATLCGGILSFAARTAAAEPKLTFTVPDGPRTAGMCGPSHDMEMIRGLSSDGNYHYFAVGTDVRVQGISIWQSDDLVNWKEVGNVFTQENAPKILNVGPRGWSYDFNAVNINEKGEYEFLTERKPGANNYRLGGAQPFWAPCIFFSEADKTYYLYYSCSAYGTRNSFIGCAKSKTLDTGWKDCGPLIHTRTGDGKQFNAIDPVVFQDADGKVWMVYGSFFGGIAIVELNPKDPSKLLHPGTHGKTIACRGYEKVYEQDGFEGRPTTSVNGETFTAYGIEGASIVYNRDTRFYYLFVSYDRLAWTYHVRVGRSRSPEGPYLDYNGKPLIYDQEKQGPDKVNGTKLIGPYRWKSSGAGWGATGHTTLFPVGLELMFGSNSKARPNDASFVGLRRVFWSDNGWPLLSPCLYGGENMKLEAGQRVIGDKLVLVNTAVSEEGILNFRDSAEWDFIVFSVTDDTTFHRTDESTIYTLKKDGVIEGGGSWMLNVGANMIFDNGIWEAPDGTMHRYSRMSWPEGKGIAMTVELPGGVKAKGVCAYGWDQDRKVQTIFFTGLTDQGVPVWGQRIPPVLSSTAE